jgi:hypothetical protein
LYPEVNHETLLRIEKLMLYLEGKGRSKNTQIAYEKNPFYLAQRADLSITEETSLINSATPLRNIVHTITKRL